MYHFRLLTLNPSVSIANKSECCESLLRCCDTWCSHPDYTSFHRRFLIDSMLCEGAMADLAKWIKQSDKGYPGLHKIIEGSCRDGRSSLSLVISGIIYLVNEAPVRIRMSDGRNRLKEVICDLLLQSVPQEEVWRRAFALFTPTVEDGVCFICNGGVEATRSFMSTQPRIEAMTPCLVLLALGLTRTGSLYLRVVFSIINDDGFFC